MKNRIFLAGALLAALLQPVMAQQTFIFRNGLNNYDGTEDIRVNNGDNFETNYAGGTGILVDLDSDVDIDYGLLRFEDIIGDGPGQIPAGSTVLEAELELFISNGGDVPTLNALLDAFNADGSYTQQFFSDFFVPEPNVHYDETTAVPLPNLVNFPATADVTGFVQRWVSGDAANNGWIVIPSGGDGVVFRTEEAGFGSAAAHSPFLTVETPIGIFHFQEGVDGYEGVVDTWIETSIPDRDIGQDDRVLADGGVGDPSWAVTRFDDMFGTGPGQIPFGTEILDAKLSVFVFNAGNWVRIHDLKDGHPGQPFNDFSAEQAAEAGVEYTQLSTWGDMIQIGPDPWIDQETFLDEMPSGFSGSFEFDVTSSLQNYSNGGPNTGWFFEHEGAFDGPADGVEWYSAEFGPGATPTLVVTLSDGSVITFRNGENGYEGVVDTTINDGLPDTPLGNGPTLFTDGNGFGAGISYALLKFDDIIGTGAGQIAPNTAITSAELVMTITNAGERAFIHTLLDGFDFDEDTTFSSFGADPGALASEGTVFAVPAVAETPGRGTLRGEYSFDVTSSVNSWLGGAENNGWVFVLDFVGEDPNDGVDYLSSDIEVGPPKLTVVIDGPTAVEDFMLY